MLGTNNEKRMFVNANIPIGIILDLLEISHDGENLTDYCPICGEKVSYNNYTSHAKITPDTNRVLCSKTVEKRDMTKDITGLIESIKIHYILDDLVVLANEFIRAGDGAYKKERKKRDYSISIYEDKTVLPGRIMLKNHYDYFSNRGISVETVDSLPLGGTMSSPRVYFTRGDLVYGGSYPDKKREFTGGAKVPFNGDRLFENHEFLFITEGWADAATIEELGGKAMAINGVGSVESVFHEILLHNNKETTYIILMDADKPGIIAEDFLAASLAKQSFPLIRGDLTGYKETLGLKGKDLNDFLLEDRSKAIKILQSIVKKDKLSEARKKLQF